jgi:hypothetical protein
MLRFQAVSAAPPAAVWSLLAEPERWSAWAPHIRGAIGLGSPEVELGRRGVVLVGLWAPVPARVSAKVAGGSWDWQTGPLTVHHAVEPHPDGSLIRLELHAPAPLEAVLRVTYGPLIGLVIRRLASVAARSV